MTWTHLDLFSGIGGFSLAAAWTGRIQTIGFCELDPWARRVLARNFPGVSQHDDIRTLTADVVRGWLGERQLDLLTGGFPCQPVSLAGQRLGEADDRYLWPEMRRLLVELRPRYLLAENVPGLISLGLDGVLADLEALGYAWRAAVIPACAVGALHRRDRVWIVAHAGSGEGEPRHDADVLRGWAGATEQTGLGGRLWPLADAGCERLEGESVARSAAGPVDGGAVGRASGPETLGGLDPLPHGLPAGLVRPGLMRERWGGDPMNAWAPGWEDDLPRTTAHEPDRVNKLKAAGNSIVPQLAFVILRALLASDEEVLR